MLPVDFTGPSPSSTPSTGDLHFYCFAETSDIKFCKNPHVALCVNKMPLPFSKCLEFDPFQVRHSDQQRDDAVQS